MKERALDIIKKVYTTQLYIIKQRVFIKGIIWIQKRIKGSIKSKYAKVEIMQHYWSKLVGQIQMRASQLNDKKMNEIIKNIILVP